MNHIIIIFAVISLNACGEEYSRVIRNNTQYGVEIINYEDLSNDGSDTFTYIDPFSEFSSTTPYGPNGFFSTPPYTPEQTDSLVINFYKEGTDTIYRKRFVQYDTTLLFQCLTGSVPPTCIIDERHLEGAKLIE